MTVSARPYTDSKLATIYFNAKHATMQGGHKVVYLTHSRGGGVFSFSNLGKYTGLQCTKWVGVRTNPEHFLSIDVLIRTFLTKSQSFFNNFLKLYDSYFLNSKFLSFTL